MLNLSDKELDRLSREAAQEYDPGELAGSRGWERLEVHLDRDLGKVGPNPMRGFRRWPFFYAPAILVLLGVSYYFVRQTRTRKAEPSGSPPIIVLQTPAVKPANDNDRSNDLSSTKNAEHSDNSTSTPDKKPVTVPYPAGSGQPAPAAGHGTVASPDLAAPHGAIPERSSGKNSGTAIGTTTANNGSVTAGNHRIAKDNNSGRNLNSGRNVTNGRNATNGQDLTNGRNIGNENRNSGLTPSGTAHPHPSAQGVATTGSVGAGNHSKKQGAGMKNDVGTTGGLVTKSGLGTKSGAGMKGGLVTKGGAGKNGLNLTQDEASQAAVQGGITAASVAVNRHELVFSPVRHGRLMKQSPAVPDSGLRAFTANAGPIQPPKKKGVLHINRSLQLGLSMAPDFSSVNSLAGDRPGSSIGLTVDYQFANHWYLSTGLLVSRKNYAARSEDYHVPYDYYRNNNLKNIDFVKGTFNMLEIPLNLRYDFSVTGNTVFFASGGLSSYLFTSENCNYYYNFFGRETSRGFNYSNHNNYLFSSVNLSLGVEAGISNSLSLLVAPYMKIPTRNVGFGQVQMNSVGINFALKFTPVLSRKRR